MEKVLDVRECGSTEGPGDGPWAGGVADYIIGWVIGAEGTDGKLLT